MKLAYIARKLVNIDNILYINPDEREDGTIKCLFVLSKDFILEEVYENREEFEIKLLEYGITKFNYFREIAKIIKIVCRKAKRKWNKRKFKRIK